MKFKLEFDTAGLGTKIKEALEESIGKVIDTVEGEVNKMYEYKRKTLDFALVYHIGVKGKYLLEEGNDVEFEKLMDSYKKNSEPEYITNEDPYAVYGETGELTIATFSRMIYLELLSVYCEFVNINK